MSTAPQNTDAPPGPPPTGTDKRRRRLAAYTFRNMVLSVLLVMALVLVYWAFFDSSSSPQQPRVAEVGTTASHAADQADYPVWVPDPGEGWTPTVAWYDARVEGVPTWHVSYVRGEEDYLAISQAADVTDAWLADVLSGGEQMGEANLVTPNGVQTAEEYQGSRPSNAETAFVLGPSQTGGSTVVVHGTHGIGEGDVEEFLGSVEIRD